MLSGDRNVVVTAEVNNSVIITGDGNTVHLHQTSEGAVLEHDYRWNRPRPRESDDHPLAPPRFDRHVDRSDEIRSLVGEGGTPRVVNVYGSPGVGKTYLLVEALNRPDVEMRDGTIYLDAHGLDVEDILHAIFEELFDSPVPIRDLRVERHLSGRRGEVRDRAHGPARHGEAGKEGQACTAEDSESEKQLEARGGRLEASPRLGVLHKGHGAVDGARVKAKDAGGVE